MAFDETFDVTNPAELAQPFAIDMGRSKEYLEPEVTPKEDFKVAQINKAVGYLGLRGTYLIEAGLAWISRPVQATKGLSNNMGEFRGLTFEGRFFEYELVKMDGVELEQSRKIRSLCLAFTGALLLPFFDKLQGDNIVYVPALAVDDIYRTG